MLGVLRVLCGHAHLPDLPNPSYQPTSPTRLSRPSCPTSPT